MSNSSFSLTQLEQKNAFVRRHIGPGEQEMQSMLDAIGATSIDDLISQTVPADIALPKPIETGEGATEVQALAELKAVASKNKLTVLSLVWAITILTYPM